MDLIKKIINVYFILKEKINKKDLYFLKWKKKGLAPKKVKLFSIY